jgi:hypothetical protein
MDIIMKKKVSDQPRTTRSQPEKKSRIDVECLLVFGMALLLFGILGIRSLHVYQIVSNEAARSAYFAKISAFGRTPVANDSRLFLLPLPVILQIPLLYIPILFQGVYASIIISVLSGAGMCALVMKTAKTIPLPIPLRWLLVIAVAANPFMVIESVNGAGTTLLMLFYCAIFYYAIGWLKNRHWLALASLGMTLALAVITHFSILALAILPIAVIGNNAWLEKSDQPAYAENAIWVVATPIVYVVFMRFLFSAGIEGNMFSFIRYDRLLTQPFFIPANQSAFISAYPFLSRLLEVFGQIWQLYPPFLIMTILLIGYSAIHFNGNGLFFMTLAWAPIIYAYLGRLQGVEIITSRWILFIIPASFFMALYILSLNSRGRNVLAILLTVMLLYFNFSVIRGILSMNADYEYQNYLTAWLSGSSPYDSTDDLRMAKTIDENGYADILVSGESASRVIAFSSNPARFITPLDEDYQQIITNLDEFNGFVLVDGSLKGELIEISADPQRYQLEDQIGSWQLIKVIKPD